MILILDENGKVQLTEKAMMIKVFEELYNNFIDKELAIKHFAYLYFMYSFDSEFLSRYPSKTKRAKAVRAYISGGSRIRASPRLKAASDTYIKMQNDGAVGVYLALKVNIDKLKNYAERMILVPPIKDVPADLENTPILVTSKEFSEVNLLLPKLQESLNKYKSDIHDLLKSKIAIYGGGARGAYE